MKIALPISNGQLCLHFGHCDQFAFYEVDQKNQKIINVVEQTPPPHELGVLPKWIKEQGANVVLAGGMGQRAQGIFTQNGVTVEVGVIELDPKKAVLEYLSGKLKKGSNSCDH